MTADAVTLRLPALPESVPAARTRLRRFLRMPPVSENALALLATELVGGAVSAGPPSPERVLLVRLHEDDDGVVLSVERTDMPLPPLRGSGHELTLRLLDRLSDGWGESEGRRWLRVHTRSPRAATTAERA